MQRWLSLRRTRLRGRSFGSASWRSELLHTRLTELRAGLMDDTHALLLYAGIHNDFGKH